MRTGDRERAPTSTVKSVSVQEDSVDSQGLERKMGLIVDCSV
jgi:hypothetical protein